VKRSFASYRRAALLGWKTRRATERARSEAAKRGWKTRRRNLRKRARLVSAPRPVEPKKGRQPRRKTRPAPANREYFVVLIFSTRKRGKTVTRRLYEAIVTMPDGSTDEEILKAYQQKVQEQHPKLHNAEIERLLFGPNAGRTIKIVPRDTPGSSVPSGSVRANDARKPRRKGRP
jgi:hypothetical protein